VTRWRGRDWGGGGDYRWGGGWGGQTRWSRPVENISTSKRCDMCKHNYTTTIFYTYMSDFLVFANNITREVIIYKMYNMCKSVSCVALWCVIILYYYIERISSMILVRERGREKRRNWIHAAGYYTRLFPNLPIIYYIYVYIVIFITSIYIKLWLYVNIYLLSYNIVLFLFCSQFKDIFLLLDNFNET